MRKSNQGFTLIELIMVIVILGVLAAFALPRFANFSGDARAAAVQGMAGGMKSAAAISHAQWLISSGVLGTTTVTMDGTTIDIEDGYPTIVGIIAAIGGASSLGQFVPTTNPEVANTTPANIVLTLQAGCTVTYSEAFDNNDDGDFADAVETTYEVTIDVTTC